MRARTWLPLVLVLVPAVAAAQGRQGVGRRMGAQAAPQLMQRGVGAGVEGGPAQMLLDRRAQLSLTDEQVSRLEGLAAEWKAAHEPMRAEMDQLRQNRAQMTTEQRERMLALREQAQVAGENARKGIDGVLTDEQRQQLGNRFGPAGIGQGRQGIRRGIRGGGAGVGTGAFGPARRPGLAPGVQLGRGPQAMAPRFQGQQFQAQRFQAQRFQRGGVLAPRMQMQRQAPIAAPMMRRWWMDPDTTM